MLLAFELSMPNRASWNGGWSGEGRCYVLVRAFKGKAEEEKAQAILERGSFGYHWPDGWGASVTVKQVDASQAAKLRRKSQGFSGYDWMVSSIIQHGEITTNKAAA